MVGIITLRRVARPAYIALIFALLVSCGPKALDTHGEVYIWVPREMKEFHTAAAALDGLSLKVAVAGESWLSRLKKEYESPDLVYTDWNREVAEGSDTGLLLDLTPYLNRMPVTKRMPLGVSIKSFRRLSLSGNRPKSGRLSKVFDLFKSRITARSPKVVGIMETLTSIS